MEEIASFYSLPQREPHTGTLELTRKEIVFFTFGKSHTVDYAIPEPTPLRPYETPHINSFIKEMRDIITQQGFTDRTLFNLREKARFYEETAGFCDDKEQAIRELVEVRSYFFFEVLRQINRKKDNLVRSVRASYSPVKIELFYPY